MESIWRHRFTGPKTREALIDGDLVPYDACSSNTLEEAKKFYEHFDYIGSNDGVIFLDGKKLDFKEPHHFFRYKPLDWKASDDEWPEVIH